MRCRAEFKREKTIREKFLRKSVAHCHTYITSKFKLVLDKAVIESDRFADLALAPRSLELAGEDVRFAY